MQQGPTYNMQQNTYGLNSQSQAQGQQQVHNQNLRHHTQGSLLGQQDTYHNPNA